MAAKDVFFGQEALSKIAKGIDILYGAAAVTLGPKGRNVAFSRSYGSPKVTKDGVSVAKEIELSDPLENMGAKFIKEVASKTADAAGDGTTTAIVFSCTLFSEVVKGLSSNMNPMDINRGLDHALKAFKESLNTKAIEVKDDKTRITQVATISSNNDIQIGEMIAKAIDTIGNHGVITVEEAKSMDTELDVVEGMQFDRSMISPYLFTNAEKQTCELENPYILLYEKKIDSIQTIIKLLEEVVQAGASLLIVAEDVGGEALAAMVVNKLRIGLKVAAVKAPGFGNQRKAILEDIAILTGGELVSEELGQKLENTRLVNLGRAKTVRIDKDKTVIVGGGLGQTKDDIEARCAQLRSQIASTTSEYDLEKLRERLAKLTGGVGVIRVGGATEVEVKERKDRVEDAVHATRAAIEEGIVPGGGVAMLRCIPCLETLLADSIKAGENASFQHGIRSFIKALSAPIRRILQNAGHEDGGIIVQSILAHKEPHHGFDARHDVYTDMVKAGIIDPKKSIRSAVENGTSSVKMMATLSVAITDKPEEKTASMGGEGMNPGMGMGF